jgi:hypothetical protein
MAAKVKKETSHNVEFAKGGTTPMFGEQAADEQPAGTTRHGDQGKSDMWGEGGRTGDKFAAGGSTKMFGFTGSLPAKGGITSAR